MYSLHTHYCRNNLQKLYVHNTEFVNRIRILFKSNCFGFTHLIHFTSHFKWLTKNKIKLLMFLPHPLYCFVSFLCFSAAESFTEAVLELQFVWTDTLNTKIWMLVLATWNGCLWGIGQKLDSNSNTKIWHIIQLHFNKIASKTKSLEVMVETSD